MKFGLFHYIFQNMDIYMLNFFFWIFIVSLSTET